MSSKEHFQCPHCRVLTPDKFGLIIHTNLVHDQEKRWFKCDICCPMVVNPNPQSISKHYKGEHGIERTVENVINECEITDERTISRLKESSITNDQSRAYTFSRSSDLVVSEMTHWYICNECYVSILYSSKIALVKHYKDEHDKVITTKEATDKCLLNDQEQIKQMIEEGRVEGGSGAGTTANLRLTIKSKTYPKQNVTPILPSSNSHSSLLSNAIAPLKDESTISAEQKSRWGLGYQQNYTSLISRMAKRKFSRNTTSPPPSSVSRSASSTIFSPDFFRDEESPDAPITTNSPLSLSP